MIREIHKLLKMPWMIIKMAFWEKMKKLKICSYRLRKYIDSNTLSDTSNTLKEIEERQKKYKDDVPKEFSKVETNP